MTLPAFHFRSDATSTKRGDQLAAAHEERAAQRPALVEEMRQNRHRLAGAKHRRPGRAGAHQRPARRAAVPGGDVAGRGAVAEVAVTGLAVVAQTCQGLLVALKVAGILYLLWLAWTMWNAPADPAGEALPGGQRPWRMFAAGLLVTLGNPKIMVFYLALLPTLLDLRDVGLAAWAQLVMTMLLVLAGIDLAWALLAARARRLLRSPRAVRLANRAGASAMAGAAVAIAAK